MLDDSSSEDEPTLLEILGLAPVVSTALPTPLPGPLPARKRHKPWLPLSQDDLLLLVRTLMTTSMKDKYHLEGMLLVELLQRDDALTRRERDDAAIAATLEHRRQEAAALVNRHVCPRAARDPQFPALARLWVDALVALDTGRTPFHDVYVFNRPLDRVLARRLARVGARAEPGTPLRMGDRELSIWMNTGLPCDVYVLLHKALECTDGALLDAIRERVASVSVPTISRQFVLGYVRLLGCPRQVVETLRSTGLGVVDLCHDLPRFDPHATQYTLQRAAVLLTACLGAAECDVGMAVAGACVVLSDAQLEQQDGYWAVARLANRLVERGRREGTVDVATVLQTVHFTSSSPAVRFRVLHALALETPPDALPLHRGFVQWLLALHIGDTAVVGGSSPWGPMESLVPWMHGLVETPPDILPGLEHRFQLMVFLTAGVRLWTTPSLQRILESVENLSSDGGTSAVARIVQSTRATTQCRHWIRAVHRVLAMEAAVRRVEQVEAY